MLKSKSVAKLIETTLNKNKQDESFRVVYEVGSYKGSDINCVLKQGKGTTSPIAGYTNVKTPFTLEVIVPIQCGEDRVDGIVDIVNGLIIELNGKVKDIDNGKSVFLFNPLEIGNYEARATAGQSVLIKVDFFVEYSTNAGTKYEMALINNPFDYGSVNTRYFDNREDQTKWFYDRIEDGVFAEILTPNINSLVVTQQRYLNPNNVDINKLLNKNYAIIRETNSKREVKHYYYYVTNANIDQYNLLILDLSMDTLQTHYIDLGFGDCFISKADINRWIDNGDGTVSFDTRPESELFEREDVKNVSKRLIKRNVINKFNSTKGYNVNNWLNENVFGWYYLFISSNTLIKYGGVTDNTTPEVKLKPLSYARKQTEQDILSVADASLYNSMVCVAFPVMNNRKKMYFADVTYKYNEDTQKIDYTVENPLELSGKSLNTFLKNLSSEYIYTMKFSKVSPLKYVGGFIAGDDWKETDDGNLVLIGTLNESKFEIDGKEHKYESLRPLGMDIEWEVEAVKLAGSNINDTTGIGLLNCIIQADINCDMSYDIENVNFTFNKSEIVGADHNIKFNPKLLSSDYMGLILSDSTQNGSEYDILKIGKKNLVITYTEALTPDITKKYIRLSNLDGYYIPETADNLTGYVVSDDTSFTLENSKYQSMLANNKNFFLQNSINRESQMYQANVNTGFNIANSLINTVGSGNAMNLVNTASSIAQNMIMVNHNNEINRKNEDMSVDNLKNAPNSINGAKGNVIFNAMYSDMGVVVEIHDILPNEKIIVDDSIKMYGMTLNKVRNIKEYDNFRRYHNYIKADIEDINGEISNSIRDDIRQRFSNGVRFWNVDEIDYSKENYERWLEV